MREPHHTGVDAQLFALVTAPASHGALPPPPSVVPRMGSAAHNLSNLVTLRAAPRGTRRHGVDVDADGGVGAAAGGGAAAAAVGGMFLGPQSHLFDGDGAAFGGGFDSLLPGEGTMGLLLGEFNAYYDRTARPVAGSLTRPDNDTIMLPEVRGVCG
jgi:hypothetical protein